MFVNLLVLIIVIAITILFGRLTVRAVKAQRLWVKIAGGLGAGLLTLLFVLLSYGGVRGFLHLYFAGAEPAPDFTVEGTPKQIARGEYLVNISCVGCHGANDSQQLPLTGGADVAATAGFGFVGRVVTANLTPGGKLADYTDGEIFRAIRRGVDKTGHTLSFMSFSPFNQLSDDDIKAIIAYLRSLPAHPGTGPGGDELNYLGMVLFGANLFPAPEPISGVVTAPPAGPTADYGRYVATFGDCRSCHGADMTGTPATSFSPAFPNPRPFVGALTLEQFIQMMRTGVRPNGTPFADGMPWRNASKMTDDDLSALYVYLTKAP
jgi:mono/diheme cytochrome c family protein